MKGRDYFRTSSKVRSPEPPVAELIEQTLLLQEICTDPNIVTLIQAPAGYGKTTLLLQIKRELEAKGAACAWVTLDAADNDEVRFLEVLVAALEWATGRYSNDTSIAPLSALNKNSTLRSVVEDFVSFIASSERPIAIILDEYEVIDNPDIHDFVSRIAKWLLRPHRIVIATRDTVGGPHSTLVVSGTASIVDQSRLKLADDQVAAFLRKHPPQKVDDTVIRQLVKQIDGWPMGLRMGALWLDSASLQSAAPLTGNTHLNHYLKETALSPLSADEREALLRLSLTSRFTPELAKIITGLEDGERLIQGFLKNGVYLEHVGGETDWYRFLTLFKRVLEKEALTSMGPEEVSELHRKIALWFWEKRLPESAIQHAIASGDGAIMTRLIAEAAPGFLVDGRLATLVGWYRALPQSIRNASPELLVSAFWAFVYTFRFDEARAVLREFETQPEAAGTPAVLIMSCQLQSFSGDYSAFAAAVPELTDAVFNARGVPRQAGHLSLAHYHMQSRSFETAKQHILEAQIQDKETDRLWAHPNPQLFASMIVALRGDASTALRSLENLANGEKRRVPTYPVRSASLLATYGSLLSETGSDDTAETILSDSLSMIVSWSPADWVAMAHFTLSDIKRRANKLSESEAYLDAIEVYARRNSNRLMLAAIGARRAFLAFHSGETDSGIEMLERIRAKGKVDCIDGVQLICSETIDLEIAEIYQSLHLRDYSKAYSRVQSAILAASKSQRIWRLLRLETLKAVIQHEQGDPRFARRTLSQALTRAVDKGFVHVFTDTHPLVRTILEEIDLNLADNSIRGPNDVHQLVRELLLRSGANPMTDHRDELADNIVETPTVRELELLQLAGEGLSNAAIAARLSVTENTVKWHLSRVYQKLGARRRTQAILRARELGLIQ